MDALTRSQLDADMARLGDGDRAAFDPVFRALRPALVSFCRKALRNESDADDAAQLALEKVFARAATFERGRAALPWALTFAAWECATIRRRKQRARAQPLPDQESASGAPSPEDEALRQDLTAALGEAIAQLSEADRATLQATFVDDAVAGALSPALRKRKERALDRLRALWRRLNEP